MNIDNIKDIDNINENNKYLLELLGGFLTPDTISEAIEDADTISGAEEIGNLIEQMCEGKDLSEIPEVILTENKLGAGKVIKKYEDEPTGEIDSKLTPRDLMSVVLSEIKRKKIAGHHIDSMNSLTSVGIVQIATKLFSVEHRMRNPREQAGITDEDKEIAEIHFKVEFTKIELTPPTTTKYRAGLQEMLTPNLARINNLTYSNQMYINATITATAINKNGSSKVRTADIGGDKLHGERIASIPCLVGSALCNTSNCTREILKKMQEDPLGTGGYFIVKGGEWTVDNLENITNNTFHVHRNMHGNEIARGQFLSKAGDNFENSYQVIMRYKNDGSITIEITTNKIDKLELPYYLLFRAMGITRDREIVNHIVYGVDNEDPVTKELKSILERAFEVDDAKYAPIKKSTDPVEIIHFIGTKMIENANNAAARKDENVQKYINSNLLQLIDRNFFPHIGTSVESRIKKLRFTGHLINRLLGVYMGVLEATDRDSYKNKRVHAAGTSMAKAFKTHFNFAIVHEVKKHLIRDFKSASFSQVCDKLAESVKAAIITSEDLERMLTQSITSGNKVIKVKRNDVTNRISSQTLYHKNDMNVKSTLATINTPNNSAAKQNERADEMRRVQPTYLGYIDPSQSHDTGEKVGMSKQMACTASVCGASSSFLVKRILQDDPEVLSLDNVMPEEITQKKLSKIFVNGDWVGCCKESHNLVAKYRTMRRYDDLYHLTTIVWEPLVREVYFWTDIGRLMRPLIIVYNNLREYIAKYRGVDPISGEKVPIDRNVKFRQWIKLTSLHIQLLQTNKITIEDLRIERVVEYISPEEQESALIAPNINVLREYAEDIRRKYTHCDIDQALFGIVTLAAPMANHSNAVRNTMYTNHRKQSCGWFALNFPFRIDKNVTLQHYCEKPLVSAFSDSLTYPNGQNTIVALILHRGMNQEDSIEANQSSVDCGMFNASHYNYESAKLEKDEQFGNPDYARTMDIKKDGIYEYVENGFIAEGTLVKKGYVLIVKVAKIPKPIDQYMFIDKSIVYKKDEEVRVERVRVIRNDEQAEIAKVKYRADRPLEVGDKLCLTPDHDVLTTRGWIHIADVTLNDEVACLNPATKTFNYQHPTKLHTYDHTGVMYEIISQQVNQKVTLNHRMFVKLSNDFELIAASQIFGKCAQYMKNGTWIAPDIPTYNIGNTETLTVNMDNWLDFLGIFISDGYVDKQHKIVISTNKQHKIDRIYKFCRNLGIEVVSYGDKHCLYNELMYTDLEYAKIPSYVWEVSQRQANILLNSLVSDNLMYFTTPSKQLANDVSRLALHCGYSANIDLHQSYEITPNFDSYRVDIRYVLTPFVNHVDAQTERIVDYNGKVHCLSVPTGIFYVRRNGIPTWTGNSSRTGNKGIVGRKVPRCDMPYCENGLVPDLMVNAHSIPTRMAVNQIIECVMAQLAVRNGAHIDATAFCTVDMDGALEELKSYGIKYGGHQRMYNGETGCFMDTLIFIGPTTYQRLQKFAKDEQYAIRTGPTSALTRQPLDGKNNDGGLRLGEMEKDVFCAHGSMRALFEKYYDDSDGIDLPVCRICNNLAVVNEKMGMYKCKYCGDNADIARVKSSWVANVFFNEASAMNVKMQFELEPYTYSKPQ
jgi:DNA-directed RNA polymerase II subunit RPB2